MLGLVEILLMGAIALPFVVVPPAIVAACYFSRCNRKRKYHGV